MTSADILIVEDEKKIRELLADYFRAADMTPIPLDRGDRVLEFLEAKSPDLILLDLMLPGTDGKTLCRQIRSFSAVPIIMLTARFGKKDPSGWTCRPARPLPKTSPSG